MKKHTRFHWLYIICSFCAINNAQALWQQLNGPYGGTVRSIIRNGTDLLAATYTGVFSSSDNGSHWQKLPLNTGFGYSYVYDLLVKDSHLYAVTATGIYTSSDSGLTWSWFSDGSDAISLASNGIDFFAGYAGGGIYVSTDNGTHWTLSVNG